MIWAKDKANFYKVSRSSSRKYKNFNLTWMNCCILNRIVLLGVALLLSSEYRSFRLRWCYNSFCFNIVSKEALTLGKNIMSNFFMFISGRIIVESSFKFYSTPVSLGYRTWEESVLDRADYIFCISLGSR